MKQYPMFNRKKFITNYSIIVTKWLYIFPFIVLVSLVSCKKDTIPEVDLVENDTIVVNTRLNPNEIAPLAALLIAYSTNPIKITLTIKGKHNDDLQYPLSGLKKYHKIPVIGLYPNHNNKVIIRAYRGDDKLVDERTVYLQTDSINVEIPQIEIITNRTDISKHPLTFVEYRSEFNVPFIFDAQGEIRWYLKIDEMTREPFVSKGNPFIYSGTKTKSYFYKYDWLGKIDDYALPQKFKFLHHDFCFTDNSFFAPATGRDEEAFVAEFDYDGYLIKEWNFNNIIKRYLPQEQSLVLANKDWANINFVTKDESDNSLIISFRKRIGVVKIDYESGDIKWIMGDTNKVWYDYPELKILALEPAANCELPLGQHSPILLKNNNIAMFDNGFDDFRSNWDGIVEGGKGYSRIVEYSINETDKTVSQVFEYGKERGKELFARICGNISYDDDNELYCADFGTIGGLASDNTTEGRIIEVTRDGTVAFEAKLTSNDRLHFFFRAEKIDLSKIMLPD